VFSCFFVDTSKAYIYLPFNVSTYVVGFMHTQGNVEMATPAAQKSITKVELYNQIAEATGMSKADVKKFFDGLTEVIVKNLGKKGPGQLTLPGMFKLKAVKKPAVKGGKTVINRLTGKPTVTKDKPASMAVRARPLKALKESLTEVKKK
jgi:nucleoid DNA-binding protein